MTYESTLRYPLGKRQLPASAQAVTGRSEKADRSASPLFIENRREARTVLIRPGAFTVSLNPLPEISCGSEIGYAISIRNTGREPLLDLEIVETRPGPRLASETVVFSANTPPILPGERRVIPRHGIRAPRKISVITVVVARSPRAGAVYRSCHLELEDWLV